MLLHLAAIIGGIFVFVNAGNIIGLKWSYFLLLLASVICFMLGRLLKAGKIRWVFKSGYKGRPKKFDAGTILYFGYTFLFLIVMVVYNTVRIYLDSEQPVVVAKPVFPPNDKRQNLLILPWQKEC